MEWYIGEIVLVPTPQTVSGALPCDGRLLSQQAHPHLARLLGPTYQRGSGQFALPDLRGRSPLDQSPEECHFHIRATGMWSTA